MPQRESSSRPRAALNALGDDGYFGIDAVHSIASWLCRSPDCANEEGRDGLKGLSLESSKFRTYTVTLCFPRQCPRALRIEILDVMATTRADVKAATATPPPRIAHVMMSAVVT